MHRKIDRFSQLIKVNQGGAQGCLLGEGGCHEGRHRMSPFFSSTVEQEQTFNRRSALRERLLSIWKFDINQVLRMCEDRQAEVDASDVSHVSWDTVNHPWPSCFGLRSLCIKSQPSPSFLLVSCWFFYGRLHAPVLLRPVGLTLDRTRST